MTMKFTKPTTEFFIKRATEIVRRAYEVGANVRIMGGLAILIHSMDYLDLFKRLKRIDDSNEDRQITDIDLITYKFHIKSIDNILINLGYTPDPRITLYYGDRRRIYHSNNEFHQVDLFIDKLSYNHTIDFGKPNNGRLELDFPTIPLSDLLLEKLQIHKIAEKDIKDVILLLRAHQLSDKHGENVIDLMRVQEVLGNDWEFWYDAKLNLEKVLTFIERYKSIGILHSNEADDVKRKVENILRFLEVMPKTKRWLNRAKVGEKKKWWNEIE